MKRLFGILVIPLLVMPSIVQAATYTPVYNLPSYTMVYSGSDIGPVESNNVTGSYNGFIIGPVEEEEKNVFEQDVNVDSRIGPVDAESEIDAGSTIGPVSPEEDDDNYGGSTLGPVTAE
ncbi:MAG: hypothetical protein GQ474_03170, partial [Sulfurimonas sp.]|nr:hypothetical protein [Sulfurimonas sp.]